MSRILRLVLVLLVLMVAGAASLVVFAWALGITDRNWADMDPQRVLALLSPGLLLPYAILTWLRPARVLPQLVSAAVCSVCYSLLLFLLSLILMVLDLGPEYTAIAAFVPGTGLALLGTYFAQGLKAHKPKTEEKTDEKVEEGPATQE